MNALNARIVRDSAELSVRQLGDLTVDQAEAATELATRPPDLGRDVPPRLERDDHARLARLRRAIVELVIELGVIPSSCSDRRRCAEQKVDQRHRQSHPHHRTPSHHRCTLSVMRERHFNSAHGKARVGPPHQSRHLRHKYLVLLHLQVTHPDHNFGPCAVDCAVLEHPRAYLCDRCKKEWKKLLSRCAGTGHGAEVRGAGRQSAHWQVLTLPRPHDRARSNPSRPGEGPGLRGRSRRPGPATRGRRTMC